MIALLAINNYIISLLKKDLELQTLADSEHDIKLYDHHICRTACVLLTSDYIDSLNLGDGCLIFSSLCY